MRFFDFLEELNVYFTASTNRYKILTNCLKRETENPVLIPKRTKTTRWSCRADATKALFRGYKKIKNAPLEISENKEELGKSRIVAFSLYNKILKIQTGLYAVFWNDTWDK